MIKKVTTEEVNNFLMGSDPMERIITIECDYSEDEVSIVYVNEKGEKRIKKDDLKPFVWAKHSAATRLFDGDRKEISANMRKFGIGVKLLETQKVDGTTAERIENGYKYMFYAKRKMSVAVFQNFFKKGGVPISEKQKDKNAPPQSNKEYMSVSPVEQYMISTGRRLFKGYNNYNDLKRMTFDLETEGLNPKVHRIEQIGIHTNKGYDKILSIEGNSKEELDKCELWAIEEMLRIMADEKPDVICGHNSENFDWDFLIVRAQELGTSYEELSLKYFRRPIYKKKKEAVLKLGGEVEYYFPTIMWGHNIIDSLHAARRAQAIDSNMKSSNLKYVTKYLNLNKENRVYVPGDKITKTWNDKENKYGFCNEDGDWYMLTPTRPLLEGYEEVTGKYIVERYLLDDIWETDKVEEKLNEPNFLVAKMLPTNFARACTMGTAGIWKLIMLAWSYEHNLAVPAMGVNRRFVGGLSRLIKVGYVDRIVKLDYNSLYPSIILHWNVNNGVDAMGVLNTMLEYVLSTRELYKGLKGAAGKKKKAIKNRLESDEHLTKDEITQLTHEMNEYAIEETANDKKQLPMKILGNSYFGSAGSAIFPWSDDMAAERTTCVGRMSLRLMISHFKSIGYEPIVGDSFTGDTPVFIKYKDTGMINILPIEELIGKTETDALGREYDVDEKPFYVLCRSGWHDVKYIYRHKTDKPLYEISDGSTSVTVTEDHSVFNDKQEKMKPSEITESTKLEYYTDKVETKELHSISEENAKTLGLLFKNRTLKRIPTTVLNSSRKIKNKFLEGANGVNNNDLDKTSLAQLFFIQNQ